MAEAGAADGAQRSGSMRDDEAQAVESTTIEGLVRAYHADVYRCAYRLSGTPSDADDLTQQTFLVAQEKLHQLRELGRARAWLLSVLRSCFLKSRRRSRPTAASALSVEVDEFPGQEPAASDVDPERLSWALQQLPEEARVILTMFYYEDASYAEIAAALDIKLGTVMSRLSRAKERLRRLLLEVVDHVESA